MAKHSREKHSRETLHFLKNNKIKSAWEFYKYVMQQCVFWIVPVTKMVFWQPLLKYKALMTNRCYSRTLHLQPPHKHKHSSNTYWQGHMIRISPNPESHIHSNPYQKNLYPAFLNEVNSGMYQPIP